MTFFPDGSSDSSELTIASRDEEDGRRVILKLAGLTGIVRRTMRAAEETFTEASEPADKKPDTETAGPVSGEKVSESPLPKLDEDKETK